MMNFNKIVSFKAALMIVASGLISSSLMGQQTGPIKGWHLLDLKADGLMGISLDRAYSELLMEKVWKRTIVAVIDGGTDIGHEDLKSGLFTNAREIPGNGKDDDKNGYADDLHGWNFMGSSKGSFMYDNIDLIRELRDELKKDPGSARAKELQAAVEAKMAPLKRAFHYTDSIRQVVEGIRKRIGKDSPTMADFRNYRPRSIAESEILVSTVNSMKTDPGFRIENDPDYKKMKYQLETLVNIDYDPREGNKEYAKKYYGNSDVRGVNAFHGTHVAGIIGADRDNQLGARGMGDALALLPIRAVPIGDAYDHDVANAIRYAVDMGAKVINLSYGKGSSLGRTEVDGAVKYAMDKDVLIVHGAGNDAKENQAEKSFPTRAYQDGGQALAWLEVAASGAKDGENLVAPFSNYSKMLVDVFAPGVDIYSTIPDNNYMFLNGTSMASPVVAGLAGLVRAYYPKLTAVQVKEIIMKSVVKRDVLKDKCISGGVVNAYEALKLAATY